MASIPAAVQPEALRSRLVSSLANGRSLVLSFGSHDADVHALCKEGLFPEVYIWCDVVRCGARDAVRCGR